MEIPDNATIITQNSYVTKVEFCQLCNISKSTGYKLIKSGEIQFEKCRDGLLHYYKIPVVEVNKFICERVSKGILTEQQIEIICQYYKQKLRHYADVIESKDIQTITGYGKESIRNWINSEKILGVVVRKSFKVAKDDLIDFLVSPYYQNIIRKSDTHREDEKILKTIFTKGAEK